MYIGLYTMYCSISFVIHVYKSTIIKEGMIGIRH